MTIKKISAKPYLSRNLSKWGCVIFKKLKVAQIEWLFKQNLFLVVKLEYIPNFRSLPSKLWILEHFEYWNFANSKSEKIFLHFPLHQIKSKLWDFQSWYSKKSNWLLVMTLRRAFGEHLVILTYTQRPPEPSKKCWALCAPPGPNRVKNSEVIQWTVWRGQLPYPSFGILGMQTIYFCIFCGHHFIADWLFRSLT